MKMPATGAGAAANVAALNSAEGQALSLSLIFFFYVVYLKKH